MDKELEKRLIEQFPSLFRDMYGDPMKTCMAWGCACGRGWFDIIERACANMQIHCAKHPDLDVRFAQIKEKFGTLRLYVDGGDEEIYNIADAAEKESELTCEDCGSIEDVTTKAPTGWVFTKCAKCWTDKG